MTGGDIVLGKKAQYAALLQPPVPPAGYW